MRDVDIEVLKSAMREVSGEVQTTMISQIAKEATKEAVTEMFLVCGIDYSNPIEMQKLMAYGKECQRNAVRNKDAIDWVHNTMETGKIFKTSIISEVGKHCATLLIGVSCLWLYMTTGGK